jgi:hypothetical protein
MVASKPGWHGVARGATCRNVAPPQIEGYFPRLNRSNYEIKSLASPTYNCIAWAADSTDRPWWPLRPNWHWPAGVPSQETLDAFISAFATLGYEPCDSPSLELGYEKIAIYADGPLPKHAARQLPSGIWTSKLGMAEDIEHAALDLLEGAAYGRVAAILCRPRPRGLPRWVSRLTSRLKELLSSIRRRN